MALKLWQVAAGALAFAVGAAFAVAGDIALGVGIAAGALAVLAASARVVEQESVAGGFAARTAYRRALQALGLAGVALACIALLIVAALAGWAHEPVGQVATFALFVAAVLAMYEAERVGEASLRWRKGADAEEAVGVELEQLRERGWTVIHDWPSERGGNVDHVVIGPKAAYAIETKSTRPDRSHFSRAVGRAVEVKRKLGRPWVTAVVCVPTDAPPRRDGHVWVVGRRGLAAWLLSRSPD